MIFADGAAALLDTLGYKSDRTPPGQTGDLGAFLSAYPRLKPDGKPFPPDTPPTADETLLRNNASSLHVLFQLTDAEINAERGQQRLKLSDGAAFDVNSIRSFLFVAAELTSDEYRRGAYAAMTREVNRRFPAIPAVVLFRTATGHLTVSFVHRRPNIRNPDRDVLGAVSLIREIDPVKPHRAHVDIISELSLDKRLDWMDKERKQPNFEGLLAAWLDELDTEELNRKFYSELKAWFDRAIDEAKFPVGVPREQPKERHTLRLITRLLFVWFIKEKRLVAEDLFIENQIKDLLKSYDAAEGDSYYRAVLQNLFFATLNTGIADRGFSSRANKTHRLTSLYRYEKEMADPTRLRALFDRTPFINGGLFDCLDSFEAAGDGGYRIDYFSDNMLRKGTDEHGKLSWPNRLFFDDKGLITLFNHYKFTVEENTPTDMEVALDPELLGKVFENLLASINAETGESARKQAGSYYTPRPVVDYMADEALVAALLTKLAPDGDPNDWWAERLHFLFDYAQGGELFEDAEKERIVRAIAALRVLDPAVGSGAFPMGVLHKLTLALRRLDPDNALWEQTQREIASARADQAFWISEIQDRDAALNQISGTFERYKESNFGRKLYLIQNSIYGVDIDPNAGEIAKLRFFISLAIEQDSNDDPADNFGIRPLPNLETRFVTADTLLGLDRPEQLSFGDQDENVRRTQQQLLDNRERFFHAGAARQEKRRLRDEDRRLRGLLAQYLMQADFPTDGASKIANWDPMEQSVLADSQDAADWFDPEFMFGVRDGFDIVIANPPYLEARNSLFAQDAKESYRSVVQKDWGETVAGGSDLLIYFFARAAKLLANHGTASFVTQNGWLTSDYGQVFQKFTKGRFSFRSIVDTSARFFSDASGPNINAIVCTFGNYRDTPIDYHVVNESMAQTDTRSIDITSGMKWGHLFAMPDWFRAILADVSVSEKRPQKPTIEFGQGINVSKKLHNVAGATIGVVVDVPEFGCNEPDAHVRKDDVSDSRLSKVPALLMPRGIGTRHYCALNQSKAFSFSGVELYLPDGRWESDLHYCLWLYMNSSFAWLYRELTGRANLGGGLLKAEATDMKPFPVHFDFDFGDEARALFKSVADRSPLPVTEELKTEHHLRIDEIVGKQFGFADKLDEIRSLLIERVEFRHTRAGTRGGRG